ncbi:unnamed protein product, partial [Rotaria sordida]
IQHITFDNNNNIPHTINNETVAIADGDTNLSRICFKEKEECRPSDSQLNTSE